MQATTTTDISPSATFAHSQAVTSPSVAAKSPQRGTTRCNSSGNGPQELFSPTSAAAWALSTLHNFGAATSADTAPRLSGDSLTGTRLFKSSSAYEDKADGTDARASGTIAFEDSNRTEMTNPTMCNFSVSNAYSQPLIATPGNVWGQPPGTHLLSVSLIEP
jgi:hypothetical protein